MISKADSTLFWPYSTEHMRVKVYTGMARQRPVAGANGRSPRIQGKFELEPWIRASTCWCKEKSSTVKCGEGMISEWLHRALTEALPEDYNSAQLAPRDAKLPASDQVDVQPKPHFLVKALRPINIFSR